MEIEKYLFEVWRPVKGYEGYYEASNYGRVKSVDRIVNATLRRGNKPTPCQRLHKGKIVSPQKIGKYLMVFLSKNGTVEKILLHRLVAFNFQDICGKWFEGCVVHHRNGDPSDNSAENLLVCTQEENNSFEEHKSNISTARSKPIVQYTLEGAFVKEWKSASEAAKELGFKQPCIQRCACGKGNTSYGYIWRFK